MDSGTTESFGREWDTPEEPDVDIADIPDIDPAKPHTARIYDYGLGGKNHAAADRKLAERNSRRNHRPASPGGKTVS